MNNNLLEIKESLIFLDIDGTLVADGFSDLTSENINFVNKLKEKNTVFLCSNGQKERNLNMAKILDIGLTNVLYKKPSLKCIRGIDVFNKNKSSHLVQSSPESRRGIDEANQGSYISIGVGHRRHSFTNPPSKAEYFSNKVVIGDKYISDGLFAVNIGATFKRVSRVLSGKENLSIKFSYLIDDIFGKFIFKIFPFIKISRLNHLVKNFIIFAPLFFAGKVFDFSLMYKVTVAFLSFSFLSSSVYVLNDMYDLEKDKLHNIKSFRPLASGVLQKTNAIVFSVILVFLSFVLASSFYLLYPFLITYFILSFIYSRYLKKNNILDILIIAFLYVIRILVGGAVTSLYVSPWIILSVFFGALFITSCKRYSQNILGSKMAYTKDVLLFCIYFSSILSVSVYSIWSVLEHNSSYLVYSSLFVVFIVFKMIEYIYKSPEKTEFPEILVFKDKWILSSFISWLLLVFFIFYLL